MSEPCCPRGLCDFRPERTALLLHILRTAHALRTDPVELARSILAPRGERAMGRTAPGSYGHQCELLIIAVQQVLEAGYALSSVEAIARRLCPHAVPPDGITGEE